MALKYFSETGDPRLFFCSETGERGIDTLFVARLDTLRERCGFAFVITSGYRSPLHSIERAKEKPGMHTTGLAADIQVANGIQRRRLVEEALRMGFRGIGVDKEFVHVDDRDGTAVLWTY